MSDRLRRIFGLTERSAAPSAPPSPQQIIQRDITTRTFQMRAESVNEEERSVEAVIATENRVQVFDMRSFEVIDEILLMSGMRAPDRVPMLESHMRFSLDMILGSTRNIRTSGEEAIGRLFFAGGSDDSPEQRAWNKVRDGHITDVSAGYRSINFVDIPAGQTQRVQGREYTAGDRTLRITTEWQLKEVSLVPIGADVASKIREQQGRRGQASSHSERNDSMNEKLRKYLESIGLRAEATEEDAWAFFNALGGNKRANAELVKAGVDIDVDNDGARSDAGGDTHRGQSGGNANDSTPDDDGQRNQPVDPDQYRREERERITGIRALRADDSPESVDQVIERAISDGWTVDKASRAVLEAERSARDEAIGTPSNPRTGVPAGHVRSHETDCTERALAAGLGERLGLNMESQRFGGQTGPQFTEQDLDFGHRYSYMSGVELCREALRLAGRQIPHSREDMIRAAVSTSSLTNIFTTSVNARLLMSYDEAEDTSAWAGSEDVPNFMTNERIGLGKSGALEKLPRGDTAKHANRSDNEETYKIARYAKQFVVDEQDLIDDRLNAILTMPDEMGAAARRLRPDLVYSILLANDNMRDGNALFDNTNHSNALTNALSSANLQTAITTMMQQTEDGVRLNLRPQFLIVPGDLEWTARELLTSARLIIAGNSDAVRGDRNVISDLNLQLVVEGRIDATGVTDPADGAALTGSGTNYFLASRPGRTVVVGYLQGTGRRPQLRSFTLDKGQWGIGWDVKMDIGAKSLDWRGLLRGNT